ncbi:uncharacterized protein GGS22DRAFT_162238 [Annulohypoxylon maeteangense]|uniref:uncharacterized protein n=1 Tax=Annulohypoxylon maeteangense TaxID=1927788 RepID=UPI00200751B4|nr:uncharacterized protein GGS22DRAFT_162238 [Annulohypoxylon maeteangense]KAI0885894.1 hypothetical protein GGS22DRAFT_162238 [Annulohypoxylon maeteangense]
MGLPLWREPSSCSSGVPRLPHAGSPSRPVIARSPITRVSSPRHTTISPRRRQLREARERRLRALSELVDNDDEITPRVPYPRADADNTSSTFDTNTFFDSANNEVDNYLNTPPTQDARALDQVVSYLMAREPLLNRDSPNLDSPGLSAAELIQRSNRDPSPDAPDSQWPEWSHGDDGEVRIAQARTTNLPESPGRTPSRNFRVATVPSRQSSRNRRRARVLQTRGLGSVVSRGSRGSGRNVDGLGDRDRSLSPDGERLWDNLLTTLTPDPQPPSVGSSFASTTASTSASQNPTVASSRTSITSPGEAAEPPCDPVSDLEGFASRDWDRQDWFNSVRSNVELLAANPGSSSEDLAFVSSMHAIIRRLATRQDIPDEWWRRAGLSRSMSWEGDN